MLTISSIKELDGVCSCLLAVLLDPIIIDSAEIRVGLDLRVHKVVIL